MYSLGLSQPIDTEGITLSETDIHTPNYGQQETKYESQNIQTTKMYIATEINFRQHLTCLLAGVPTSLSPSGVKATTDGVVLDPSAFSNTFGVLPSITATQEFVVPRSMPHTAPRTASELQP